MSDTPQTRCGFAAVIGSPNAGKSTLVNALVGEKVTIVTHKVQTTRFAVRGVALDGASQIVLVDTPGVFAPTSNALTKICCRHSVLRLKFASVA